MKNLLLALLTILLCAPALAFPKEDESAIRRVAEKYIAGVKAYDESLLKEAFHPSAHIKCVVKASEKEFVLSYLAMEWVKLWAIKEHPADQIFKSQILSIERLSEEMAVARVEMSFQEPPKKTVKTFTDSLAFVRVGGDWKILNKVCTSKEL